MTRTVLNFEQAASHPPQDPLIKEQTRQEGPAHSAVNYSAARSMNVSGMQEIAQFSG